MFDKIKQTLNVGTHEWQSWSKDIRFTPATIERPSTEEDVVAIVQKAIKENCTIKAVASSHSSSPIFQTNDILLSGENLTGMTSYDKEKCRATIKAGTSINDAGKYFHEIGFGLENTGHIDAQQIAGAICTGTHGAGKKITNLSGMVTGVRLVDGLGNVHEYNDNEHSKIMQALKVSVGALGIFTEVTLQLKPSFKVLRRQYNCSTEDCLNNLEWLMEENTRFAFYWYPRRDDVVMYIWNDEENPFPDISFGKKYKEKFGWGKDVIPSEQELRFNEMEFSVGVDEAPELFKALRKRLLEKHRKEVAWRILFRPIAKDNIFLSNGFEKDIVAITIHQNHSLPWKDYFYDMQEIFKSFNGRPHWGKKHTCNAAYLKQQYPKWDEFHKIRKQLDPNGIFMNDYLKQCFLEE